MLQILVDITLISYLEEACLGHVSAEIFSLFYGSWKSCVLWLAKWVKRRQKTVVVD